MIFSVFFANWLEVLAVQNMEATGVFGLGNQKDIEFTALEGSLSMMSKGALTTGVRHQS
jgi:hypothetical protein